MCVGMVEGGEGSVVNTVLPFDVFFARSKNWVRKKFYFFSDTGVFR